LPDGTIRIGSLGLLAFSLTSLFGGMILPYFVRRADPYDTHLSSQILWKSFRKVEVGQLWLATNALYSVTIWASFFVASISGIFVLISIIGICWSVAIWAPFAIISTELQEQSSSVSDMEYKGDSEEQDTSSGAVLGLHNVAIAVPQILAALCGSAIFKIFEIFGWADAIGWTLRLAATFPLLAVLYEYSVQRL
jgi:solute carrier family 45 protein 1/2/4